MRENRYDISLFIGNEKNVKPDQHIENGSFLNLANRMSKCIKGGKHSAYWTRGKCDGNRCDDNIRESKIIVIDGDIGTDGTPLCDPKTVHKALKGLGINHFVYTTHSHIKGERNKFRAVVECSGYIRRENKEQLEIECKRILNLINKEGCNVAYVKEMGTWSQPWFFPFRDNPKDGGFEFYKYMAGDTWQIGIKELREDINSINTNLIENLHSNTMSDMDFVNIMMRGEGIHNALINKSMQMAKEGMNKEFAMRIILQMLSMSRLKEFREERYKELVEEDGSATKELERIIYSAWDVDVGIERGISVDDIQDLPSRVKFNAQIPRPPGLMGKFYDEVNEMLRYPDDRVAMVTVLFILASICGRKFNVDHNDREGKCDPMGLNLYLTLCGSTGSGKDEPKRIAEKIFYEYGGIKDSGVFITATDFTSVKAMFNALESRRSLGVISGEAGITMQGVAGDKAGVKAATLSMYGRSAWNGWSDAKNYSDKNSSVQPLRAVALTRLSESTESELFAGYNSNNAIENGMVSRESIFRMNNVNTNTNRRRRIMFSEEVGLKLKHLIEICATVQMESDPKAHIIWCDDDVFNDQIFDYQDELRGIAYGSDKEDASISRLKQVNASRAFVKALKFTGLATIMNKDRGDPRALCIDKEEYEWGKRMCKYELDSIEGSLGDMIEGGSGIKELDEATRFVVESIIGIIKHGKYPRVMEKTPLRLRKNGWLSLSALRIYVNKFKPIQELTKISKKKNINSPDGFELCIGQLVKDEAIYKVHAQGDRGRIWVIRLGDAVKDLYSLD